MSFVYLFRKMFIPRLCVICGDAMSIDSKEPICKKCQEDWEELLKMKCVSCGREKDRCTCLPSQVREIYHSTAVWCVFYDTRCSNQVRKFFYKVKRSYIKKVIRFVAGKMANALIASCKNRSINYKDFAITYVPRRTKSVVFYCFDHAKKLALEIGKILGVPVVSALRNKSQLEQKNLNKKERKENASKSFFIKKNFKNQHKKYFLVDDIMTSGSSLLACAKQLYQVGAEVVIPVTFAKDN